MDSNNIYKFNKITLNTPLTPREILRLEVSNSHLHFMLAKQKNRITQYYNSRQWDKCKKFTNNYELIFTSSHEYPSICAHNAISRSFFKLQEIMQDLCLFDFSLSMKALFLAEGPGGFIESFIKRRQNTLDNIFGMTLIDTNRNVPSWKLSKELCAKYNINLLNGKDGSGSLYRICNIDDIIYKLGPNTCDFITADGGFDFSNDFNKQEDMCLRLIVCEIYAAIHLQKTGGTFVLKIFDIHKPATIAILYMLYTWYDQMYIIKPLTSRPANSEKYVVVSNANAFESKDSNWIQYLHDIVCNYYSCLDKLTNNVKVSGEFMQQIVEFNQEFISNQVAQIEKTIEYIDQDKYRDEESIINRQVEYAKKWCEKYGMKVSEKAVEFYSSCAL